MEAAAKPRQEFAGGAAQAGALGATAHPAAASSQPVGACPLPTPDAPGTHVITVGSAAQRTCRSYWGLCCLVDQAKWQCSAGSNSELVQKLHDSGLVTHTAVREALLATDRAIYVPELTTRKSKTYSYGPYADAPQSIGCKATISAPHIHALALEALCDRLCAPACRALDVGCGSGVLVACMARMGDGTGVVVGVERVPDLVTMSVENLRRDGMEPNAVASGVVVVQGDGWRGETAHGPYDAIHVGAAAPEVPQALIEQLRPGGRIVIPVGGRDQQDFLQIDKASDGGLVQTLITRTRFVPLVGTPVSTG